MINHETTHVHAGLQIDAQRSEFSSSCPFHHQTNYKVGTVLSVAQRKLKPQCRIL